MDGSRIEESPLEGTPGFEITGGSLGQGLSQAVGMALGERLRGRGGRVYCLLSDGELQEGQVWEAFMSAGHHGLDNLVVMVDNNRMQADGATADVMTVEPVPEKLDVFRVRRATARRKLDRGGARRVRLGEGAAWPAGRPRLRERCRAKASRASRCTRRCTTSVPPTRSGRGRWRSCVEAAASERAAKSFDTRRPRARRAEITPVARGGRAGRGLLPGPGGTWSAPWRSSRGHPYTASCPGGGCSSGSVLRPSHLRPGAPCLPGTHL